MSEHMIEIPEGWNLTQTAQLLLGLAEDVNHVQTTTDGRQGTTFVVPDYLHKLYLKAIKVKDQPDGEEVAVEPDDEAKTDSEETPAKRKPGRPKNTDN